MGDIVKRIVESYRKYLEEVVELHQNPRYLQVVIQVTTDTFFKLAAQTELFRSKECFYIQLHGRKTPIIVNDELNRKTEFIVQSRADYEREEKEKLAKKFFIMFEEEQIYWTN